MLRTLLLCLVLCSLLEAQQREPWTTSRIKGSPEPPSAYKTELAFPKLKFDEPVDLTFVPGSNELVVVERFGKIYTFENSKHTERRELLLDLRKALDVDRVESFGIAFHPKFTENGRLFIHHHRGDHELPTRVSEFHAERKSGHWRADPASEKLVISWPNGHNGGCVKFGADGYLYISNGDQGGLHDPDEVGQGIDDLQASILRIDIDVNVPDAAQEADVPAYRIPRDNPFVAVADARHEVWAYGLRNAWKMSFDRKTGDLWAADIGEDLWEAVHKIERGGNYGWSVEEGGHPFRPGRKRGPTPIQQPIVSHDHSESRSITGGYVYRGAMNEELVGHYIYGDYDTGIVWELSYDGNQVTKHRQLCDSTLRLVSFGEDRVGELYLVDHIGGYVHRIVRNEATDSSADFPRKLSETGLFASTAELLPAAGLVPYEVAAPQWSDGSTKQRYMALPGDSKVEFEAMRFPFRGGRDGWKFPDGSVLVETHFLEMEQGNPDSKRRIETRVLHHERLTGPEDVGDQLWRGYSYVWNDDQTDAELLENPRGLDQKFTIRDTEWPQGERTQTWHFPGRTECMTCHNMAAKYVLGCQTLQTNHDRDYSGKTKNQLDHLQQLDLFTEPLPKPTSDLPRLVDYHDETKPLEDRARSYLHANCSHCHRNGGGGNSGFFALASLPLDQLKLLDAKPDHGQFHIPGAKIISKGKPFQSAVYYRMSSLGGGRMPRLGSSVVDRHGLELMHDWIASMGENIDARSTTELNVDALQTTAGSLALARAVSSKTLPGEVSSQIIERAVMGETTPPHVRDLFERFVPEEQRVKRLGSSVDPQAILDLDGDVARGRHVYFEQAGVQCKSCHRIGDRGQQVGPDLDLIGKKYDRAQILTSILEPSRKIDAEYLQYQCVTVDGKTYSGVITERTEKQITLRDAKGKEIQLVKEDIEVLAAQSTSLMPDLLLRDMTVQQVADLVAFLASLK